MTKTFYSRIDLWTYLLFVILLYPLYISISSGDALTIILIGTIIALSYSIIYCVYRVDAQYLRVQCGPLPYPKMQIQDIVSIRKSHFSIFSAPALSLDRITVTSRKGSRLVISPRDRIGFIQALTAINPDIKVDDDCLLDY